MDEQNRALELEQESLEAVDENVPAIEDVVAEQMDKLRRQAMLLGAQSVCRVILQKIGSHLSKPGKNSFRDYQRCLKDIEDFCRTGISRKVNLDGTTSPVNEEDNNNDGSNE